MYMEFNGIILNYENVLSFRKAPVDKSGKYPIIVDNLFHDSTTDDVYKEFYDTKEEQEKRFDEIKSIVSPTEEYSYQAGICRL